MRFKAFIFKTINYTFKRRKLIVGKNTRKKQQIWQIIITRLNIPIW